MFRDAASRWKEWMCNVGGGSGDVKGKLHGIGCLFRQDLVMTARHIWEEIRGQYAWPVTLRQDGLFRCEKMFESTEQDILLLKCVEKLEEGYDSLPNEFPKISNKKMRIGDQIGFISSLRLIDSHEGEEVAHTCFSEGSVSFMLNNYATGLRYVISSTVMQKGFSGSPVFYKDSSFAGILVQSVSFRTDMERHDSRIYVLPVVAPIFPIQKDLLAIIT